MTLLGFDFGLKRIGVAVGQTITKTATPLLILQAENGIPDWQQITNLIQHWRADAIVVGIPVNLDGSEQPITLAAKQFVESLREKFSLPVHEVDERLTTVEARQYLFDTGGYKALQKANIDSFAAKLLIEQWISRIYDKPSN